MPETSPHPALRPTADLDLRWVLAGERTLLAWFRLSLALFLLGLALVAFVPPGVAPLPVSLVAAALMVGCAAAAVTGVRRWRPQPDGAARSPTRRGSTSRGSGVGAHRPSTSA